MTISLTPKLEKFVEDLVSSGHYKSSSEVIRAALQSLADRDLRAWLCEGLDALARGERVEAKTAIASMKKKLQ